MGGGQASRVNFNIWGVLANEHTRIHAHTQVCMHTHVLNVHITMHVHVYTHSQTHIMHACTCIKIHTFLHLHPHMKTLPEFRESDMLPTKTEVKQGEIVEFVSLAKGSFRKTY